MPSRSTRYVAWIDRHARAILVITALAVAASAYLTRFHLPLEADLRHLLPADAPAVRDAERMAGRMPAKDTMIALIVAPDAATRAEVADGMLAALHALPPELVERVESDDAELRAYVRAHRHLFVPLAELTAARDALAQHLADAKAKANPLLVQLDDEPAPSGTALDELRAKQREADAKLDRPAFVSADGRTQVIVVRTAFLGTDIDRDRRVMGPLEAAARELERTHPDVRVGFAGGPAMTLAEHGALTRGILLSSVITLALVALVLLVYLRSVRVLALVTANIVAATLVAFGFAALTVGHLNAATAFLGAIIAGNGVNYGVLLVARHLEERRGAEAPEALAKAIAGTLRPTLVASLGAAIAYAALGATKFRGFADFAWIGGAGMLVCWASSFLLLPALLLRFARGSRRAPSAVFGTVVVKTLGFTRPAFVCVMAGVLTLAAGWATWRYATDDPYEYDMTQLRSHAPDAQRIREWMKLSDETFGRGLAGIAGQTFIAVDDVAHVPLVVDKLRALAVTDPIVGPVASILDVVPPDQEAKLAVLADLRTQIDEAAGMLDGETRDELLALRPADDLAAVSARDLPPALAAKLTERDGAVGRVIAVRPGASFDEYDGRDLIAFADAVRSLELPGEHPAAAGPSLLFADVLVQIRRDGPLVTVIAIVALLIMVIAIVGRTRRAFAVLAATTAGTLAMVAVCAAAGLKINFLDFVALPITLGLGIDYAINIADRAATADPREALRSTGGTVLVCSMTTIIGYASLLVSDNLAIRGFGLASLIGEITCVLAAFVVVPAIVALPIARRRRQAVPQPAGLLT
ncbi:MAG TPA: MMPL family transporter [Kofleriaceae bacterium]|nr:MMPL family transporter [Kofleriaceae bacterium]